ncbi:Na+/H+ antiporter subunit E [Corynebacterium sp. NPDC060344]|uniref:Na+/H+ antiporter subunit E n=1 Tax=Corynebacterium sp. NPDC060344 TaxID=3347101 RepID=UPI003666D2B6
MTVEKQDKPSKHVRREERRKARPSFILFLWIVVMWQLLWGEITWANIFGGIGVALLISVFLPMPRVPVSDIDVNWPAMIVLFATFVKDFIVASFTVAWLAVRRQDPPPSAIVEVPMRTRDDLTLASAIALINLQPGGLVIDIDNRRKTILMHLLDGSSTGRIDDTVAHLGRMERQVVKAFENRVLDDEPAGESLGHDHAVVQGKVGRNEADQNDAGKDT